VVFRPRPQEVAEGGGDEEEMADVDEEEASGKCKSVRNRQANLPDTPADLTGASK